MSPATGSRNTAVASGHQRPARSAGSRANAASGDEPPSAAADDLTCDPGVGSCAAAAIGRPARLDVLAFHHPQDRLHRGCVGAVAVEGFIAERKALQVHDQAFTDAATGERAMLQGRSRR